MDEVIQLTKRAYETSQSSALTTPQGQVAPIASHRSVYIYTHIHTHIFFRHYIQIRLYKATVG